MSSVKDETVMAIERIPMATRFWRKVTRTAECWLWLGARGKDGYGRAALPGHSGGMALAHRISWLLTNGEIPSGMQVLHRCDNRQCVRPDHLFLGTQADNIKDMWAKGRQKKPEFKTHCHHGHELAGSNLYVYPDGERACRVCATEAMRNWREKRKQA